MLIRFDRLLNLNSPHWGTTPIWINHAYVVSIEEARLEIAPRPEVPSGPLPTAYTRITLAVGPHGTPDVIYVPMRPSEAIAKLGGGYHSAQS